MIRLLACRHERYLQGAQYLYVYHQTHGYIRFWVSSLTNFRHGYQQLTDHVSFERSTFLIVPESQKLIRLKCIRGLIILPIVEKVEGRFCHTYSKLEIEEIAKSQAEEPEILVVKHVSAPKEEKKEVCVRTRTQVKRCVQVLMTSYLRELDGSLARDEIFSQFENHVKEQIQNYKKIGI